MLRPSAPDWGLLGTGPAANIERRDANPLSHRLENLTREGLERALNLPQRREPRAAADARYKGKD